MNWNIIICLLDLLKNDFGEVDEAMIECDERPYELISCNHSIEKSTRMKSLKWCSK
jgi:hypothetical protein